MKFVRTSQLYMFVGESNIKDFLDYSRGLEDFKDDYGFSLYPMNRIENYLNYRKVNPKAKLNGGKMKIILKEENGIISSFNCSKEYLTKIKNIILNDTQTEHNRVK